MAREWWPGMRKLQAEHTELELDFAKMTAVTARGVEVPLVAKGFTPQLISWILLEIDNLPEARPESRRA